MKSTTAVGMAWYGMIRLDFLIIKIKSVDLTKVSCGFTMLKLKTTKLPHTEHQNRVYKPIYTSMSIHLVSIGFPFKNTYIHVEIISRFGLSFDIHRATATYGKGRKVELT